MSSSPSPSPPSSSLTPSSASTSISSASPPYYQRHVFFCCNQRDDPNRASCNNHQAQEIRDYAKARVKALGLSGKGKVRVNQAGCLDRCDEGPVIVVYPEEVWYTYVDRTDVDEIIEEHLRNGRVVERLRI